MGERGRGRGAGVQGCRGARGTKNKGMGTGGAGELLVQGSFLCRGESFPLAPLPPCPPASSPSPLACPRVGVASAKRLGGGPPISPSLPPRRRCQREALRRGSPLARCRSGGGLSVPPCPPWLPPPGKSKSKSRYFLRI